MAKNKGGRPHIYNDVSEIEQKINDYFTSCEGTPLLDNKGNPMMYKGNPIIVNKRPLTVTGLALALGFKSRQALINYQNRDEKFNDAISRAKSRIEQYAEERLFDNDGTKGAQFALRCNFGWKEDKETAEENAPDDGFIKALDGKAAEDWSDDDE